MKLSLLLAIFSLSLAACNIHVDGGGSSPSNQQMGQATASFSGTGGSEVVSYGSDVSNTRMYCTQSGPLLTISMNKNYSFDSAKQDADFDNQIEISFYNVKPNGHLNLLDTQGTNLDVYRGRNANGRPERFAYHDTDTGPCYVDSQLSGSSLTGTFSCTRLKDDKWSRQISISGTFSCPVTTF